MTPTTKAVILKVAKEVLVEVALIVGKKIIEVGTNFKQKDTKSIQVTKNPTPQELTDLKKGTLDDPESKITSEF